MKISAKSSNIFVYVMLACALSGNAVSAEEKPVHAGWIEDAHFPKLGIKLQAKLDTGAKTSSLHGGELQLIERDGNRYLRFFLPAKDGQLQAVERPVLRVARIRRAGTTPVERPVIALRLCIAGVSHAAEFTVTDRSGMNYQVLLGRRFLAGRILVDSSRKHLQDGQCR